MATNEELAATDWAVVVGLSRYPGLGNLDGPENDAKAFHAWLTQRAGVPAERVRCVLSSDLEFMAAPPGADARPASLILSARPTSERIEQAFDELCELAKSNDERGEGLRVGRRLYIFLAGHGFTPTGEEVALLMANATPNRTYHVAGRPYANYFVKAGIFDEVVLFMDCCRERYLVQVPLRVPPYVDLTDPTSVERSKILFGFATRWSRLSREKPMPDGKVRGVFSTALVAGLNGAAVDAQGDITARSLADYLYNHMKSLLSPEELKDDDIPKEPELVYDTNPNARFLLLQGHPEASAPRFPVTVHLRPEDAERDVEILDSRLHVAARAHAPGPAWSVTLEPGLYLGQVREGGRQQPFEVSGLRGLEVRMPDAEAPREVPLRVRTEDPESEVFLIDGGFRLMDRSLGALEGRYPPGLYKVKVQTGARIRERFVRLEPGGEQLVGKQEGATLLRGVDGAELRFPRLAFATAVPLTETSWSRDEHTEAAVTHSRQVHARLGRGSWLFVLMRTWTTEEARAARQGPPAPFELSLRSLDGRELVDLVAGGAVDDDLEDPWVACNVELDPGTYLLRVGTETGLKLDYVVVASSDWQTQVFLCRRQARGGKEGAWAGTMHTSVHMRRPAQGFDPESPGLRLTELTRIGLRNRRAIVTPELLKELKGTEQRNPMLGLYGAHLLMMADAPDLELVRKMVGHLGRLLGMHPDVEALAMALGDTPLRPGFFSVPPMLLKSWALVVRETVARPELVPRDSLASAVAERLWGEGPWVVWKALPPGEALSVTRPKETRRALDIELLANRLQAVPSQRITALRDASALERALLAHLYGVPPTSEAVPGAQRQARRAPREELPRPTVEKMVRVLGVPAASLEVAMLRLLAKLEGAGRATGAEAVAAPPA
ncbi:caspase family protein [Pyxidicoccus xibeiensis]|uniref:caspase family protein n=1 Tax=Pyxidicoccus xibeiensis TaxID=2906759 RepID=UPI00225E0469|nr:caspase family protein [Pyxidicoccus xibeiensis]